MSGVAVLGVFNADLVFGAARLPAIGETLLGSSFAIGPGGKGSNQAVAAARAGGNVTMLTRLGRDTFGDLALKTWRTAGISTDAVIVDDARPTGAAFIFVSDETGDNAIIVGPGAASRLSAADMDGLGATIAGQAVFVTQLEQPLAAAVRGMEIARAAGVKTILDPAPADDLSREVLALADYLTPNEGEAEALTGVSVASLDEANEAARRLRESGANDVVLTLGARGVLHVGAGGATHVPPFHASVVDTTGAGDAFNGAFATALADGADPTEAIRFASAAASLSVEKAGAASAMPDRDRIEARLRGEQS